jgi:Rrf2 family protein
MLGMTRKTDYALVALACLAEASAADGEPLSVRRIAERYGLPLPQMMSVLKDLQRSGLVESTRGVRGGYRLAVGADWLELISVIEAVEGPVRFAACCDDEPEVDLCVSCQVSDRCPITVGTKKVHELIVGLLRRITIRDLMESRIDVTLESLLDSVQSRPTLGALSRATDSVGTGPTTV